MNYKMLLLKLLDDEPNTGGGAIPEGNETSIDGGDTAPLELSSLLGTEYKDTASLQDFKSVDALAKSYVDLKQQQGSSLRIPSSDAGEEAIKAFNDRLVNDVSGVMLRPDFNDADQSRDFYRSLGAPEEANGYEFQAPEGANGGIDEDRISMFRELAHKEGLTKTQFANIMGGVIEADMKNAEDDAQIKSDYEAALRNTWGHAYDQNKNNAMAVAKATGAPDEFQAALADGNVNPATMEWMNSLSSKFGAEGMNFTGRESPNYKKTPDEIRDQITEINGNKKHAYWNNSDPDHAKAVQRMLELQRSLNT